LEGKRDAMLAHVAEGQTIPMTVRIDYSNKDRYFMAHSFDYANQPVRYEYYSDGNGVIYIDNLLTHNVRMISSGKSTLLQEVAIGLPEILLHHLLEGVRSWKPGPVSPGFTLWTSAGQRGDARLWLAEGTSQIARLQVGSVPLATDPPQATDHVSDDVQFKKYRTESGYTIPEEVIYKDPVKVETWKLVRFTFEPPVDQMHSTQYQLRPRCVISDETGPVTKKVLSDELMRGK